MVLQHRVGARELGLEAMDNLNDISTLRSRIQFLNGLTAEVGLRPQFRRIDCRQSSTTINQVTNRLPNICIHAPQVHEPQLQLS